MEIKAFTDLGNAERFLEHHKEEIRYCPEIKMWLIWNGSRWQIDENGIIHEKAKETVKRIQEEIELAQGDPILQKRITMHAMRSQEISRINAIIKLVRTDSGVIVNLDCLDSDPMLLNCSNGTVDLRTGILLPHSREQLITRSTSIHFDPDAQCPQWEAFIEKILGPFKDKIDFMQKIIGYALTGQTSEQCLFILWGYGANGKSTLLEIIRRMMGDYARHTPSSTLLTDRAGIRNDLARLKGARFVSAVEVGIGKMLDEALTKELTGGDPITSRFLFREYFEQKPTFKLFLAVNQKPEIRGIDHGIWRRIRLIPFETIIPDDEIDRDLSKKLEKELPGILAWAVRGCLAWQKEGLSIPESLQAAIQQYKQESDQISGFIEDTCVLETGARIPVKILYDIYKKWSEDNAAETLPKKTFGHLLRQRGIKQGKSDGVRYWKGIGLKVNNREYDSYSSALNNIH